MKASIDITIKKRKEKSKRVNIDVAYDTHLAEIKMVELGDAISLLNKSAMVTVEYSVYSEISSTWVTLRSYYPKERKLISH